MEITRKMIDLTNSPKRKAYLRRKKAWQGTSTEYRKAFDSNKYNFTKQHGHRKRTVTAA